MSIIADFHAPVTAFPPGESLSTDVDVTVELERAVPVGGDSQYLWVVGDDLERAVGVLEDADAVRTVETLDRLSDRVLVRVRWRRPDIPLVDVADACGATILRAVGTGAGWTVAGRFPDESALEAFHEACRRRGIQLDLRGVHWVETGADSTYGMSSVQRETLRTALELGYFDVPRRATLTTLAEEFDVTEQAVSERLRRGLANYLGTVLTPTGDGTNAASSE